MTSGGRLERVSAPPLRVTVFYGDAVDALTWIDPGTIQACVTDPPYGLTDPERHDNHAMMRAWRLQQEHRGGRGIHRETWDGAVPGPDLWRGVRDCLVPGAAIAAFSSNRTYVRTAIALAKAGLQEHDLISWMYSNATPFNANQVRYPRTVTDEDEEALQGHAPQLMPGHEPILIFRKPRSGPQWQNILSEGVGGARVWDVAEDPPGKKAKNTWVLHENGCINVEGGCVEGCAARDVSARSGATPIFPSESLTDGNIILPKPTPSERVEADGYRHPTQKSIAVMQALIRAYSLEGHTIIDPFCGSGATAEAAILSGRNCIGMEVREEECAPSIRTRVARAEHALGQRVDFTEFRVAAPKAKRFEILDENDSVGRLLREAFVRDDSSHVESAVLANVYREWAVRDDEPELTAVALAGALKDHGLVNRASGGSRRRAWYGLRPRTTTDTAALVSVATGEAVESAFPR